MIKNSQGFTLVELVFTITLIAIVCSIGLLSMKDIKKANRFNSSVMDIRGALEIAKSEAIKGQTRVAVSFTLGEGQAGTYMVFIDNGATAGSYDEGEAILEEGYIENGASIYDITFPGNTSAFNQMGLATSFSGEVYLSNEEDDKFKRVMVTNGGIIRIENSLDKSTWTE